MFRKFLLFLFFAAMVLSTSLFAQEKDEDSTYTNGDDEEECTSDQTDNWDWDWSSKWDHNHWGRFDFKGQPTIEADYGVSAIGSKAISGKFADAGAAELKLSYSSLRTRKDYIAAYKNNFLFLSTNSMDLRSQTAAKNDFTSETWRFGFGEQKAYAYKVGNAAIIPYTSNAFVWTRLNLKDASSAIPGITPADAEVLDNFNQTFRFGTYTEGGIKLQIVPVLTFNGGYERAIVFPRHMFWKHAGSMLIELVGTGALDAFVREIMDSSPAAGPIVNFVLKNGFSYALYQLRREKMNWPFETAAPLTYDTWKVGLTFTF